MNLFDVGESRHIPNISAQTFCKSDMGVSHTCSSLKLKTSIQLCPSRF